MNQKQPLYITDVNNLTLSIYTIGYPTEGETILTVICKKDRPIFTIVTDCYNDVMERLPNNYLLMIAGDGILKEKFKSDIQERHLEKKCVILDKLRQEELPALYKASDLFLLASDYEIYGMVILEAMYFGTPVISTLTAGSEVLITSGEDGVIIPNKKADRWSNVISSLCNDTTKLSAMSSHASRKIAD